VVDTEFSLAYGGKILLHQTKLLVRRGRRYGLVGKVRRRRKGIGLSILAECGVVWCHVSCRTVWARRR
jgi:hypothetical protein